MFENWSWYMWTFVNSTAFVGIFINMGMLYFVVRHARLRRLSIGGLLMMSAVNDIMLNTFSLSVVPNALRSWLGVRVTYMQCTAELSLQYFALPAAKSALLLLTIDRVYGVWRPIRYRGRNHARFASRSAVVLYLNSTLWLLFAMSGGNWSSAWVNTSAGETCSETDMFTSDTIIGSFVGPMIIDLATYVCNAVLVCLLRKRAMSIAPETSEITGMEMKQRTRERAITKSVLSAVGAHFCMTTAPSFLLIGMSLAMDAGEITANTFYIGMAFASWMTFMESIINVYIYVVRLPHFKEIVLGAFGRKTEF